MSFVTDYCSLSELKAQLRTATSSDDTALGFAITAASRQVDQACNRHFGLTGSAVARLYDFDGLLIEGRDAVPIDDLQTTVGLVVTADTQFDATYAGTLVLNTDFDLYPWNAAADGSPWTHMVMRPTSSVWVSISSPNARYVSVTGNWGWSAVPTAIKQATLIQAARVFQRRESWAGIAGSPELGNEMRLLAKLDADVQALVQPYIRWWGAV